MINQKIILDALMFLANDPSILEKIKLPDECITIPMKVMDKGVFWNTIGSAGGYKLQKNMFTRHCRIIDSKKIRRAWGTEKGMEKLFNQIINANQD